MTFVKGLDKPDPECQGLDVEQTRPKPFKQTVAESHYLPGRNLADDVREARRQGHSWRDIKTKVNELLAKNPTMPVTVTHESLRQWYGDD